MKEFTYSLNLSSGVTNNGLVIVTSEDSIMHPQ